MHLGRIGNIKKTFILKIGAWITFILALFFILITTLYFKRYDLWFFEFCFFIGCYFLLKAILYKMDSPCYLGSLLSLVGLLGGIVDYFSLGFGVVFMLCAVSIASLIVFVAFKQYMHLILASIFMYEGLLNYLFLAKNINLTIFLILNLILLFIFLFICAIIFMNLKKRS